MEKKEVLVEKTHWDNFYRGNFDLSSRISNSEFLKSYYHLVLFAIIGRFVKSGDIKSIIEVGCAPGNYLVKFKKYFNLTPYGLEYSENGYQKTLKNLAKYRILESNIFLNDFFDNHFLEKNTGKYDAVFSAGFIEHFDHPENIVLRHGELVRSGGLVICLIPNKRYINAFFTTKESLTLHNRNIMDVNELRSIFEKSKLEVLYCNHLGGIINVGLFQPKSLIMRLIYVVTLVFQRIFLDSLHEIYFKLTKKDLVSKYSSPSLLCIARKL